MILEVEFELKQSSQKQCEARMKSILKSKTANQPQGEKCAGSIFKNPAGQSAWELISKVNMKGKQVGGAMVSNDHANFIINTGKATAEHVVILIAMIKQRVRSQLGIQLQEEIQYVGF